MQITFGCVCMESLLCGVSADNEFGCSAPRWKCSSCFSTFSSSKCLGSIIIISFSSTKYFYCVPFSGASFNFCAKIGAATTKPPQKGVKRENPFSVQTLSTASQKIQKYKNISIQKYRKYNIQTLSTVLHIYHKIYPATVTVYSEMLRALLCFIEEEGYFPLNIGAGKIQ